MPTSQYLLYAGSYAIADSPGISAFTFDALSGKQSAIWLFAGIVSPSFIVAHPNGRWLYAVSETSQETDSKSGEVWALALPQATETEPRSLNHFASGGDWPCHLVIDGTGQWLLVSNYATGSLGVFPIQEDGTLGPMTDLIQHQGKGTNPERQAGPHAHSAIFTPDNRFVIVADLGIDQLAMYAFDAATGRLHTHTQIHARPGSGPRHMAFHPRGQQFYVAHELDNTVVVYNYDPERGELIVQQRLETLPPGVAENTVAHIALAPASKRLYVSNRGHDSVAVFAIAEDGRLERVAVKACGGRWPRHFAITPDERFLCVANQQSDEVTILPILDEAKTLDEPLTRIAVPGASCVQIARLF